MPEKFPCPACGFLVFEEPSGSYDICQLCGWEDDHVQLTYPGMQGGANRESLAEKQATWLERYPVEVREAKGIERDPAWRPLSPEEVRPQPGEPESGLDYFKAAASDTPEYYWRPRNR
jgi:hypothetical protein